MKPEGHLQKAKREEKSTGKLHAEEDSELIIEGLYGAAHHYIAFGLESKHDEHSDKHEGDSFLLRKYGHGGIAAAFTTLDSLRAGDFYGGRTDGERVEKARQLLSQIKEWAGV